MTARNLAVIRIRGVPSCRLARHSHRASLAASARLICAPP